MWHKFKDEKPKYRNPWGYLVIVEGCTDPMMGQFDEQSKRFYVFCPPIGKAIQVPVKLWFEIPAPPQD